MEINNKASLYQFVGDTDGSSLTDGFCRASSIEKLSDTGLTDGFCRASSIEA